jgi:hypothetical protein
MLPLMKLAKASASVAISLGFWNTCTAQPATLAGLIKDASTGEPTPCTVSITDVHGRIVTENESFQSGFRCPGQFRKQLPPGKTRIRITRGFETKAVERDLNLAAGEEAKVEVSLVRLVDLRKRGWYSGDSHAHMLHGEKTVPVDFDFVALTARAQDLEYLSLAQSWILEHPTPEALNAELNARSRPDCFLTWNLEAPKNYYKGDAGRCLGHCWNLGVRGRTKEGRNVVQELLNASASDYESEKPTYANFESHSLIHEQGGAVFYTHPARWWLGSWGGKGGYPKQEQMRVSNMAVELPLDTLIGPTFDGLDVLTTSGEQAANAKAFEVWSLLLNHGYRLAATASSDACFDRPGGAVPGSARTYTFLPKGFSFSAVTSAMAAGNTFATTGPLQLVTLDSLPPGSVFASGSGQRTLAIEAWPPGDDPHGLSRVQILRNGSVVREFIPNLASGCFQTNVPIQESQTAWYSLRTFAGESQNRIAVSSAFYFTAKESQPPKPVPARVRVKIIDARSGKPLSGTVTEVQFQGTIPRSRNRHVLPSGEGELLVPATTRLRAEAKGYAPCMLSPFLDCPPLVETVTQLSDSDLLDWRTFEKIRHQLSKIELVFRLQKP